MPNLKELLTFEYESAYDFAYDLKVKKRTEKIQLMK